MADRDTVQLHLLRHAHAGDPEGWTGPDAARPLSAKGEQQAERLGRFLAEVGFKPDAIITLAEAPGRADRRDRRRRASASRSARTNASPGTFDLVTIEAILFDAGEPAKPVLVGHDPDFSELAGDADRRAEPPDAEGRVRADRRGPAARRRVGHAALARLARSARRVEDAR